MTGLLVTYLILFVLGIWMLVRIFRGSAFMGLACIFIPGAIFFALLKNWNDPDSDIKIPFFISIVLTVFMYYSAVDLVESEYGYDGDGLALGDVDYESDGLDYAYAAEQFDDEQRAQIRLEDPVLGAKMDAAERAAKGGSMQSERWESPSPDSAAAVVGSDAEPVDLEVQRLQDRRAARTVLKQSGTIEIGPAYSKLDTPSHFRFLPVGSIKPLARLYGREVGTETLGWVIHERVNLLDERAWFAEVRFQAVGHLQADGVNSSAELQQAVTALGRASAGVGNEAMYAPQWSADRQMMTWTRAVAGSDSVEAVAALPLRHGVLSYVVRVDTAAERELALRTARLMATQTQVGEGWGFDDAPANSPTKGPTLARWVVGATRVAQVVEAADDNG